MSIPCLLFSGAASIKQYHILTDKRHVITKDSEANVAIYDVLSATCVKNLGKVNMEAEIKARSETVFVPNWFTVDLKIGVSQQCYVLLCFLGLYPPRHVFPRFKRKRSGGFKIPNSFGLIGTQYCNLAAATTKWLEYTICVQ